MAANDPRDGAIFDPRSMVGRIYVELHMTLRHTKHASFGLCCFREEDFFMYFHHEPKADNDVPEDGLYGPQGHGWQDL